MGRFNAKTRGKRRKMTIQQAVEYFIINQRLKGNTDKTVRGYKGFLGRLVEWMAQKGITALQDISIHRINEYQLYVDSKVCERGKNSKLTKRSVQTYMRHIKAFMTYCFEEELINEPIHQKMKIPKAERPVIEILTEDEIDAIFGCFKVRNRLEEHSYNLIDARLRTQT